MIVEYESHCMATELAFSTFSSTFSFISLSTTSNKDLERSSLDGGSKMGRSVARNCRKNSFSTNLNDVPTTYSISNKLNIYNIKVLIY